MAQRWPAVAVGGGVALFWVGDLEGGRLQPGYSFSRDYVSALAGYGARAPWVGVAAIAASGLAHAAAGRCVRTMFPGARLAPAALVLAGAATLVVAASRITCVGGAAGCHLPGADATRGWTDTLHGAALLGYEAAFVGSAVAVAALAAWGGRPPLAAASAAVAIASPYPRADHRRGRARCPGAAVGRRRARLAPRGRARRGPYRAASTGHAEAGPAGRLSDSRRGKARS